MKAHLGAAILAALSLAACQKAAQDKAPDQVADTGANAAVSDAVGSMVGPNGHLAPVGQAAMTLPPQAPAAAPPAHTLGDDGRAPLVTLDPAQPGGAN